MAILTGGAILMALEVAAFRVIGRTFGSALRETTAVISVFLTAMSLGYYFGGRAGDRWPRLETLTSIFFFGSLMLAAIPALDAAASDRIAGSSLPMALHAFAATTVLFFLPITLLSAISPVAVRLFAQQVDETGSVAGGVSALSTIGSVVGSVGTAFLLLDLVGSINRTVTLLALTSLLIAACLEAAVLTARRYSGAVMAGVLVAFIAAGVTLAGSMRAAPPSLGSLSGGGSRIIFERDTPYHQIRVTDRTSARDLWMDGTLQSRMFHSDHQQGLEYPEYGHIAKVIHPSIRRVLMLGLGGGTAVKQFSGYYPDVAVDAVDVDPVVIDVASRLFDVKQSDRVRLYAGDGRAFLASAGKYDLILIDVYARGRYGTTLPPHMVTREFFSEVVEHLNEGGLVHFHCYASRQSPFTRAIDRTLSASFPALLIFGQTEFIAATSPIHYSKADLVARAGEVRKHVPRIDDLITTMQVERLDHTDVPLLTDDYAPVDTLLGHGTDQIRRH